MALEDSRRKKKATHQSAGCVSEADNNINDGGGKEEGAGAKSASDAKLECVDLIGLEARLRVGNVAVVDLSERDAAGAITRDEVLAQVVHAGERALPQTRVIGVSRCGGSAAARAKHGFLLATERVDDGVLQLGMRGIRPYHLRSQSLTDPEHARQECPSLPHTGWD